MHCYEYSKRKLVEVEQCNEQTIENFQNYLIERNMTSDMDSNIRSTLIRSVTFFSVS